MKKPITLSHVGMVKKKFENSDKFQSKEKNYLGVC